MMVSDEVVECGRGASELRYRDEATMLEVADAFASKLDDRFQNQVQGLGHVTLSNHVVGKHNPSHSHPRHRPPD